MNQGPFLAASQVLLVTLFIGTWGFAQEKTSDWDSVVAAANQEGRLTVSVPTSADLRKAFEQGFEKAYPSIDLELIVGRGSSNINKIIEESKAGVHNVDLHVGGTTSIITGLVARDLVEPLMPMMLLDEIKEADRWWGGHIWADNANKYIYSFAAYMTETLWYNSDLVKPQEIDSYDDLLNPKWQGQIAILDPRTPGSGESTWAFLWKTKGEEYLKKLVAQDLVIGRNQRQLAEAVAKGKSSLSMGLSYYTYSPFIKAGLPVKPISEIEEGFYASSGSGNVVALSNAPHPNAAKVFLNWLLSKNGQALFTKALGQPTRRLDVDTRWTKEFGHVGAKEILSLEKYRDVENSSETAVSKYRKPGRRLAEKLLSAQ